MNRKKMIFRVVFILAMFVSFQTNGQEFNATVSVIANRISTQIDRRIFVTLQKQLTNLINNRKWTTDNFKQNERIDLNVVLNLDRELEQNVYGASLTIQAARPVYNTNYNSPLVNWQDNDVVFRYVEFQPVEFAENRVAGTEPLNANLTAIIAYYIYIVLGADYDSYELGAGSQYFKKALFIVNNAPQGRSITGWTQFDGLRNRYWLAENVNNTRYSVMKEIVYEYYRKSLDNYFENEEQARTAMVGVLNNLFTFNNSNPNTMVLQFFMQSKSDELLQIFKQANGQQKAKALEILQKIDVANANKYIEGLKG